ncbi:metal dependent phosphohydrolase [Candidatus Moduliflexus flocculans]|uniref:Metal dependent phosphohydrolase n=1 Tax=Candidatus Moduliflexus flocculans TaxID=1499966 RepID=A0A0S6VTZ5_9BACT|nr:metal dependent phosphohydrolase [Candidatus Moduliflexus flocculans]
METRFEQQLRFIQEIDRLKQIFRRTYLMDSSRPENDAEHSWHLAVMAMLLAEYAADSPIDTSRVIKMVLVHDLVEIDAGDTYLYDERAGEDKSERERRAADRIFGLLPEDQARELRALWDEFETRATPEAKFALALDRFQPLYHNYSTKGISWQQHGVTSQQVLRRLSVMQDGAPRLWEYAQQLIRKSVESGYLAP